MFGDTEKDMIKDTLDLAEKAKKNYGLKEMVSKEPATKHKRESVVDIADLFSNTLSKQNWERVSVIS